jgi:hypothetical protein
MFKFPENNRIPNRFVIKSLLYKLMTYHWKGLEKGIYNFVVRKHFNQNSYEKIKKSHKILNKFGPCAQVSCNQ